MDVYKAIKKFFKHVKKEVYWRRHCDEETWIDYPGVGKITDRQVWEHVRKHTRWFDFLNPRLIVHYALASQNHLMGVYEEEPNNPNWKYPE